MDYAPHQFDGVVTGRRAVARLRVRLPATLTLISGETRVVLLNLSQQGARIGYVLSRPDSVHVGSEAVLVWHRFETFCQVRWVTADGCGLLFEEPIGLRELMLTRALDERNHLPPDRDLRRGVARRWVDGID